MISKEQRKVLAKAIKTYGTEHQQLKCVEECSELAQAVTKMLCENDSEPMSPIELEKLYDHIIEEVADVIIMMEQMVMMLDEIGIRKVIDHKIDRLAKRMGA